LNDNDDAALSEITSINVTYEDSFSVMCTQHFQEVQENQKLQFSLHHGDYKYFVFHNLAKILNSVGEDERLVINIMPLIGSGFMSMTLTDNEHYRVPHISDLEDFSTYGTYM
jgi:hypothetical protein